jgi:hypothetical protein
MKLYIRYIIFNLILKNILEKVYLIFVDIIYVFSSVN